MNPNTASVLMTMVAFPLASHPLAFSLSSFFPLSRFRLVFPVFVPITSLHFHSPSPPPPSPPPLFPSPFPLPFLSPNPSSPYPFLFSSLLPPVFRVFPLPIPTFPLPSPLPPTHSPPYFIRFPAPFFPSTWTCLKTFTKLR